MKNGAIDESLPDNVELPDFADYKNWTPEQHTVMRIANLRSDRLFFLTQRNELQKVENLCEQFGSSQPLSPELKKFKFADCGSIAVDNVRRMRRDLDEARAKVKTLETSIEAGKVREEKYKEERPLPRPLF